MNLIYDIAIHLALILLSPFILIRMITTGKHSSGLLQKFGVISPRVLRGTLAKNVIWIHAVSVGETMAAMPLVKRLKHEHPELMIVFSTITPTGNAVAMKEGKGIIDSLIYFPLDLSWIVRRVVRKVNPKTFILIEKEIWPNTLRIMNEEHVPVIVVNGSISKKSFKNYKRFSFLFKNIFSNMEHYMGCTDADTQMAITLGVKADKATTCGNLKFDVKAETKEVDAEALRSELMVSVTDKLFIAGSTHDGEEAIIISSYLAAKKIIPELKLIIAPRHSNRCNKVEELLKNSAIAYARRSYHETLERSDVLILDTMGELVKFYSIANLTFVGGTLVDTGGHNLLEPAMYSKPVLFGTHLQSYKYMAEMLENAGGGIMITEDTLKDVIIDILKDNDKAASIGQAALSVVTNNTGATDKAYNIISKILFNNDN